MSRGVLITAAVAVGLCTGGLTFLYLDWRRPILPIGFDTPRSST